ncbi:hypothetical protein [Micromonospora sp. NBC_01813]|uniref:hypothetical protein n=1 Tax=Micromonospora sp. NBC_01813 TaxID=2975988 RepID=UPI002DD92AD1|nr:hypothetical protein [Micromonospora sp. NBC_01813]WSA08546.1 hypothetical protein OG958_30930 [Micromonospora sp. NBC_01813]
MTNDPLVKVGDTVSLNVGDYGYGLGRLVLRVARVDDGAQHPGIEWIQLIGVEVVAGEDQRFRAIVVRADALRRPGAVTRPPGRRRP